MDPCQAYQKLILKLERFFKRTQNRYPTALQCQLGCDACCKQDLSLFPFEVTRIMDGYDSLSESQKSRIIERAELTDSDPSTTCVFLEKGACLVYAVRPILCRTQGLALWLGNLEGLSVCQKNFNLSEIIEKDYVLDLNTVNSVLALVHNLWMQERECWAERISLKRAVLDRNLVPTTDNPVKFPQT